MADSSYLDITSSSIQVQMQVQDFSIISEFVLDILLRSFFMNIRDHYDPPFNGYSNDGSHREGMRMVFGKCCDGDTHIEPPCRRHP